MFRILTTTDERMDPEARHTAGRKSLELLADTFFVKYHRQDENIMNN